MKVQNYKDVKGAEVAPGAVMRILAGPDEGAPTFVMRLFEVEPGGGTPHHTHPWEHEIFVVEGNGTLKSGNTERPLVKGDAIMVLPNETHGILNTGKSMLRIICVVPLVDGKMPGTKPTGQGR
jgi:quercetin dioxygenase-like cupin family protein